MLGIEFFDLKRGGGTAKQKTSDNPGAAGT
jgi:hypothetical protein